MVSNSNKRLPGVFFAQIYFAVAQNKAIGGEGHKTSNRRLNLLYRIKIGLGQCFRAKLNLHKEVICSGLFHYPPSCRFPFDSCCISPLN